MQLGRGGLGDSSVQEICLLYFIDFRMDLDLLRNIELKEAFDEFDKVYI